MNEILVVDDDALMRNLVADWLTEAGYRVRQAQDGTAALAALRATPARLLITDMRMPNLNGAETLAVLSREFPELPVIAMSGDFSSRTGFSPELAVRLGACKALAKPFARDELLAAVRELAGDA